MNAETIKTLAEYITELHDNEKRRELLSEHKDDAFDTNGVEQDHAEIFYPSKNSVSSGAK